MARHYQEAAIAAAAGFGKDWPNTLKADIEASCEPVHRNSADGAIAMNRIVVTHERRMVVSGEGGENRSASSMTLGQEQQCRDEERERQREGSVNDDGYVSETTTTTTRDAGPVGGARFVQRQGSTDQMVQREDDEDVDLERGERRRSHRR